MGATCSEVCGGAKNKIQNEDVPNNYEAIMTDHKYFFEKDGWFLNRDFPQLFDADKLIFHYTNYQEDQVFTLFNIFQ